MVCHSIIVFPPFFAVLVPVSLQVGFALRPVLGIIYLVSGKLVVKLVHLCFCGRTDMLPCTRQSFLTAFDGICGGLAYLAHVLYTVIRRLVNGLAVCPDNIIGSVIITVQRTQPVGYLIKGSRISHRIARLVKIVKLIAPQVVCAVIFTVLCDETFQRIYLRLVALRLCLGIFYILPCFLRRKLNGFGFQLVIFLQGLVKLLVFIVKGIYLFGVFSQTVGSIINGSFERHCSGNGHSGNSDPAAE